jgi:uncharacterized membrane protein YagU involved in acid resistance
MRWLLGTAAAIAAWLGWLWLSPALGFPRTATAAMFDRFVSPMGEMAWLSWAVLLAGEAALALIYAALVMSGRLPRGLRFGMLYGTAVWLITGAVVMPLMTLGPPPAPMADDAMRTSFMMLHLGPLAPLNALLGRLFYGVVLGATSRIA